ncbi:MAG: hypothetical protein JSS45_00630 [Proteobacteria bacterium]|nr:hypothetical protein [Pseudomonadota bacterium]
MARALGLLMLLGLLLVLPGCSMTLVESLPTGAATTCDPAWPGAWRAVEHGVGRAAQSARVVISADCRQFTFSDADKTQTEPHVLRVIRSRAGDFVTFANPGDADKSCFGDGNTHCGIDLMRYVRNGDRIELFKPDHRRVHEALEAHLVSGYTEMRIEAQGTDVNGTQTRSQAVPPGLIAARAAARDDKQVPTYHNLIAGGPEQITQILVQHPEFFADEPFLILQRDGSMNPSVPMP